VVRAAPKAGVLGVLPGVMGSLQATEVVKILLGRGTPLLGRLLVYDALDLRFQELRFARRPDCAACGDTPHITSLSPEPETEPDMIEEWTPAELQARLAGPDGGAAAAGRRARAAGVGAGTHPGITAHPAGQPATALRRTRRGPPAGIHLRGRRAIDGGVPLRRAKRPRGGEPRRRRLRVDRRVRPAATALNGRRMARPAGGGITLASGLAPCLAGWLVTAGAAQAAAPSPGLDAARELRRGGCGNRPGTTAELLADPRLDAAARAWSRGADLTSALAGASAATRATVSLRTSASQPSGIAGALRRSFCDELTDARYSRWGAYVDGRGTRWLLLAVPAQPPDPARAGDTAAAVLAETNRARATPRRCGARSLPAAPPLSPDTRLTAAARAHAATLARLGRLEHDLDGGSTPATRARGAGYDWRTVGENLAAGPETAAEVVAGWLGSPGHCANLMDPAFTQMGLAFAVAPADGRAYWVQLFGTPRASPAR
jgi:uncharacterized protein YkwD